MVWFISRRMFHGTLILLGVSLITFFLLNQSPGDYFSKLELDPQIKKEWLREERARLKLDRPWYVTYTAYLQGIVTHLDFGKSFEYKRPVFEVLKTRLKATLLLAITSMVFAWVLSLPL